MFSDVHGNVDALRKMIDVEGEEGNYLFCGDLAGYYYDALECMYELKRIHLVAAVRGNHDQYYIDAFSNCERTNELCIKYGNSYKYKSKELFEYMLELPVTVEMNANNKIAIIQHGSLSNRLEGRWYPDTEIEIPKASEAIFVVCGHTHYRMHRIINGLQIINPGSLGQPRDGMGFSYCILETDSMEVEFRNVSIDLNYLERRIKREDPGKPYLINVLRRGHS